MLSPLQFELPPPSEDVQEWQRSLLAALQAYLAALNGPNVLTIAAAEISECTLRGTRVVTPIATGSNRDVAVSETRVIFTNEGATARQDFTLPTAVAGLEYGFYCQDADGIRVIAASGDTIRIEASVSAAAGRIDSTTIGSAVVLVAINATEWVAISKLGTWTVT